jgi:hypothetical protein
MDKDFAHFQDPPKPRLSHVLPLSAGDPDCTLEHSKPLCRSLFTQELLSPLSLIKISGSIFSHGEKNLDKFLRFASFCP